jgi:hypothetical protein
MSVQKTYSGSGSLQDDVKAPYNVDQDTEPGSPTGANSHSPNYMVDHEAERALCRKFDFRLLPVLAVMYLFNALDKGMGWVLCDLLEPAYKYKY